MLKSGNENRVGWGMRPGRPQNETRYTSSLCKWPNSKSVTLEYSTVVPMATRIQSSLLSFLCVSSMPGKAAATLRNS